MLRELEETHCEGCKKKPQQTTNNSTVQYCNTQCDIGKKIRSIGDQLLGVSKTDKELKPTMAMKSENYAKLKYVNETFPFLRQKDMANILGVAASQISMALKTSNYKVAKADPSIQEHAENYVKKYYPDKAACEEKASKLAGNQESILKVQGVQVPIEKLEAVEKEIKIWRNKALSFETYIKELEAKYDQLKQDSVEESKHHRQQYAALSEQYETVTAAHDNAQKEIVSLKSEINGLKETNTDSKIVFALKEENALLKSKLEQKDKIAEFLRNQNSELELKVKSVQFTEKLASQLLAVKIQECL